MALSPFDGPIPGQSLTAEPSNAPWEKPSKFSDPLDALEMYIERLADDEVLNDGYFTKDLSSKDFISTSEMGDKVLERIIKQC